MDSGASCNCLNEEIVNDSSLSILPSLTCPVGASGATLENKGDIYGTLIFSDGTKYRDRFTLIRHLPFGGIIGIRLLQNRNFQVLKDGKYVKLGNQLEPRILGTELIVSIKDDSGKFSCGTENLASPLSGTHCANQRIPRMETSPGNDQPDRGYTPNTDSDKPILQTISPIISLTDEATKRRNHLRRDKTPSKYVGESVCPGSRSSNVDAKQTRVNPPNPNIEKLLTATTLKPEWHQSLRNTLQNHTEAFSLHDDDLGCFVATDGGPSKVNFEVRDPTLFVHSIPRRVAYERRTWLEDKLKAMEKTGIIDEVQYSQTSLQTSPIVIVAKKNGKFRMAVDYREVNKNIKPSTVPLPNVKDCIECLAGKRFFSALDITSAFNQVELTESTKDLLGFVTLNRRYRTNRMPFGVNSCPGEFQLIVTRTLRKIPPKNLTVYLDDILIHTETFEEHLETLDQVCTEIRRHGLKLNPLKCDLVKDNIEYLGFVIGNLGGSKYGYKPLENKVKAIQDCPLPTTPKEVRQFCGSLQYYNSIIKGLNVHLSPLHRGSAKKPFTMTTEMTEAFKTVKSLLADEISVTFPDFTKPFTLTTDASYHGAAGILTQDHGDGPEIIYTFSKAFSDVESRWAIVELELLAFVWSLEKMRTLLLGRHFTWITDSLVLKQMIDKPPARDMSRSGRKISRFLDFINEFNFTCVHCKGDLPPTQMADFLSRAPIAAISNFFRIQLTKQQWIEAVNDDEQLVKMTGDWARYRNQLFWEDDLMFVAKKPRAKLAVPMALRTKVMQYYHHHFTLHGGTSRMVQLIAPLFIWPDMHNDIRNFVNACKTCNLAKPRTAQQGVTTEIAVPTRPMEWIQIDLVVLVSPKNKTSCQYLLTAICTLTNYFQMQPLERKTGPDIIKALGRIFCVAGVPKVIQSDNGSEFRNNVVQQHAKWLSIEWRFSTPYKPSTQGRVERRHAELAKLLRILGTGYTGIEDEIPYIQLELNASQDKITQLSPFECFHGWEPHIPHVLKDFPVGSHHLHPTEMMGALDKLSWEEELRESQGRVFRAIHEQHQATRYQNTLGKPITPQLVPGDMVMIKNRAPSKLESRAEGPYQILKVNKGGTVHVKVGANKTKRLPPDMVFRYKHGENTTYEEKVPHDDSDQEETHAVTTDNSQLPPNRSRQSKHRLRPLTVPDYSKYF